MVQRIAWVGCLLLVGQVASAEERPPLELCTGTEAVELHASAARKAPVVGKIQPAQACEYLEGDSNWARLRCEVGGQPKEGWASLWADTRMGEDNRLVLERECFFVQATSVKLRPAPKPGGTPAAEVRIRTRCERLEAGPEGWVRVRCGEDTGWTKTELLSRAEPTAAAMTAKAKDSALSAAERLSFAERASVLDPNNSEAKQLVQAAFVSAEREAIAADAAKSKREKPASLAFTCKSGTSPDELLHCLESSLRDRGGLDRLGTGAPAVFLTSARECSRYMVLVAGAPVAATAPTEPSSYEAPVLRRYEIPREVYARLISWDLDPNERVVTCAEAESRAKATAAARRALKGLPQSWVAVDKDEQGLVRHLQCTHDVGVQLRDAGEAGLQLAFDYVQDSERHDVQGAQREGSTYTLSLGEGKRCTFTYPSAEDPEAALVSCSGAASAFSHRLVLPVAKKARARTTNECPHP